MQEELTRIYHTLLIDPYDRIALTHLFRIYKLLNVSFRTEKVSSFRKYYINCPVLFNCVHNTDVIVSNDGILLINFDLGIIYTHPHIFREEMGGGFPQEKSRKIFVNSLRGEEDRKIPFNLESSKFSPNSIVNLVDSYCARNWLSELPLRKNVKQG